MKSLFTHPHIRTWARRLHLTHLYSKVHGWFRRRGGAGYEEAFWMALKQHVKPGDIVWDVGANVGLYSTRLAVLVGEAGRVMAFESFAPTATMLREASKPFENITVFEVGLGSEQKRVSVVMGENSETTSVFVNPTIADSGKVLELEIQRGGPVDSTIS